MRRLFCLSTVIFLMITCLCASAEELGIVPAVVRLHVIADDDTRQAQFLKLQVRDGVLETAKTITGNAKTPEEALKALRAQVGLLQASARQTALECGFSGPVCVTIGKESFPAKRYGNVLMKAGEYQAVCVKIGRAEGHNWWCVIYPSLCYFGTPLPTQEIVFYSSLRTFFTRLFGGIAS